MRFSASLLLLIAGLVLVAGCSSHKQTEQVGPGTVITSENGSVTVRQATAAEMAGFERLSEQLSLADTTATAATPVLATEEGPPDSVQAVVLKAVEASTARGAKEGNPLRIIVEEFNAHAPEGWALREFRSSEGDWRLRLGSAKLVLVRRDPDDPEEWQVAVNQQEVLYFRD
ncbi:MAG: hypothetical protein HYV34_00370 [Candidatus Kerfeldbacteria bacterium]|nr:hypothetical protein [Candidatus Kerfeldbacteria bacterium]